MHFPRSLFTELRVVVTHHGDASDAYFLPFVVSAYRDDARYHSRGGDDVVVDVVVQSCRSS